MNIKISNGNIKLGNIPSVSLPAGITCRSDCDCQKKCYAKKLERLRKTVREAYQHNLEVLIKSPDTYWREVEASIMMSRFFRFHVSGDIVNEDYFIHMTEIAERNPHCQLLCFTKKFGIVNEYLAAGKKIPDNFHIIFSAWRDLEMDNPFNLPEAHVRYRDGFTTASDTARECGGNCTECAITEGGCWNLTNGEQVVFNEH